MEKFNFIIGSRCDSDESDDEIYTQYTDITDLLMAKDHVNIIFAAYTF